MIALLLATALVASMSRCNDDTATQLEDRVRSYDAKHVSSATDLDQRVNDLADVIRAADAELDIVGHVCATQSDLAPISSQLYAVEAWGWEQQAEAMRAGLTVSCPGGADAVAAGFLAAGWRRLTQASQVAPSPLATRLDGVLRAEAAAVKLSLPPPKDMNEYWVQTIQQKGNAAAGACPATP